MLWDYLLEVDIRPNGAVLFLFGENTHLVSVIVLRDLYAYVYVIG